MGLWHLTLSSLNEWHALEKKSANMDVLVEGGRVNGWRHKRGVCCGFFELRDRGLNLLENSRNLGAIGDIEVLTS